MCYELERRTNISHRRKYETTDDFWQLQWIIDPTNDLSVESNQQLKVAERNWWDDENKEPRQVCSHGESTARGWTPQIEMRLSFAGISEWY